MYLDENDLEILYANLRFLKDYLGNNEVLSNEWHDIVQHFLE